MRTTTDSTQARIDEPLAVSPFSGALIHDGTLFRTHAVPALAKTRTDPTCKLHSGTGEHERERPQRYSWRKITYATAESRTLLNDSAKFLTPIHLPFARLKENLIITQEEERDNERATIHGSETRIDEPHAVSSFDRALILQRRISIPPNVTPTLAKRLKSQVQTTFLQ